MRSQVLDDSGPEFPKQLPDAVEYPQARLAALATELQYIVNGDVLSSDSRQSFS